MANTMAKVSIFPSQQLLNDYTKSANLASWPPGGPVSVATVATDGAVPDRNGFLLMTAILVI